MLNAYLGGMLERMNIIACLPTTDYDKAQVFYEGTLGLKFLTNDGFALVLEANGIMVRVAKVANFKPLPYTILGWEVPDIVSAVAELQTRGVKCEVFGFPGQNEDGVWTAPNGDRVAWFKDPDGNVLSVSQHVGR